MRRRKNRREDIKENGREKRKGRERKRIIRQPEGSNKEREKEQTNKRKRKKESIKVNKRKETK